MGLLDLLLGKTNPVSQFADSNSNTLGALGAGIAAGPDISTGLARAAQAVPQAKALDQQTAIALQSKNATVQMLQAKYPDLAEAIKNGVPISDAWAESLRRDADAAKQTVVAPGDTVYQGGKPMFTAPAKPLPFTQVAPGATLFDPNTNSPKFTAPAKPQTSWRALTTDERATAGIPASDTTPYQVSDTGQIRSFVGSANGGGAAADDGNAAAIAKAIASGSQPPVLTGLYKYAGPVRAALAKSGYDLTSASEDWTATQKQLATMNGAQQTRLRQAVGQVSDTLDLAQQLADQWRGSGYPLFNKATLALAAQGAPGFTPEQTSLATRLIAQVADVTSDLGTVYKGGNSSTDESLKLAATQLSADWSEKTFDDAVKQAKQNIQYRKNSLQLGTAGIAHSQYNQMASTPNGGAPGGAAAAPLTTSTGVPWSVGP